LRVADFSLLFIDNLLTSIDFYLLCKVLLLLNSKTELSFNLMGKSNIKSNQKL